MNIINQHIQFLTLIYKKIKDSESYKNFIHKNGDCKKIIEIGKNVD